MNPIYLGDFDSLDDVKNNFSRDGYKNGKWVILPEEETKYDGVNIMLAWYEVDGYEGYAFVLFNKDGKLYTVEGSHCSCYGLEGQWSPDETTAEALRHRMTAGYLGKSYSGEEEFSIPLSAQLDEWENDHVD